jgi:hypothetical protein
VSGDFIVGVGLSINRPAIYIAGEQRIYVLATCERVDDILLSAVPRVEPRLDLGGVTTEQQHALRCLHRLADGALALVLLVHALEVLPVHLVATGPPERAGAGVLQVHWQRALVRPDVEQPSCTRLVAGRLNPHPGFAQ